MSGTGRRVVVAEPISDAGLEHLDRHTDLDVAVGVDRPELLRRLGEAAGLVVRSATKVDAELVAAAPGLRVVGRAGIGVDNIDLAVATAAGVLVVNAPSANAISSAEHTMALLLSQARRVPEADRSLRSGAWERNRFQGVELHGKTLGVLGLGRIGSLVAARAAAFGMRIVAHDPYVGEESARRSGAELAGSVQELIAGCDFLTIHLPLTAETEGILDAGVLAAARPGLRIVNTSRGGIVDEAALATAIRAGTVAGAALDVFATEPLTDSPLFELDEVVVTPHLGASTAEAQGKAGMAVAEAVVQALDGELVASAVNVDLDRGVPDAVLPFLPLTEMLGAALVKLAGGLGDQLTVRVEGRLAEHPAKPLELAALKGALGAVSDLAVGFVNAPELARARGLRVTTEASSESPTYASVVQVAGDVRGERITVAGTLVASKGPVLVEVLDHAIELPFSPYLLILLNDDVPGMIGMVGTFLGDADVNIANMVVGRTSGDRDSAMMGLNLDRPMTQDELGGFRRISGVRRAWFLDLSTIRPAR